MTPVAPNRRPRPTPIQRVNAIPPSSYWIFVTLGVQVACQLGLLFEALADFRIIFRSGAFGINIVALFLAFRSRRHPHHPSFWLGIFCLIWMAAEMLHPNTNTAISAIASVGLSAAIMAPLFWVPRLQITPQVVRAVIICLWAFHSLSAFFGVLQVYSPGNYQPAISQAVLNSRFGVDALKVRLADQTSILRPMGLTDTPGGAANAGLYAFVFGLGLYSLSRNKMWAVLGLAALPLGMFCIYLSHTRVMLVLAFIISIVYAAVLWVTGRLGAAVRVSFAVPLVLIAAFLWAVTMGGAATSSRFETLIEDSPGAVYNKNRGHFLEETFEEHLPDYPFGAGLGRWGMINAYFGDRTMVGSTPIWSEIQWTCWIYDGGFILLFAYTGAILTAIWTTAKIAFQSEYESIAGWALLIVAYDVAMFAFTFSYPLFESQAGMEFWLLNAMIWTAARQMPRRPHWRNG